jgi:hypothetical protein
MIMDRFIYRFSQLLLGAMICCAPVLLSAQDLIVTTAGDSIVCTITAVREKRLYFTVQENDRDKNRTVERALVASYRREGFAPVDLNRSFLLPYVEPPKPDKPPPDTSSRRDDPPRWALFGGYGWVRRLGSASDELGAEMKTYNEGLRSGRQYSLGVNYSPHENFGIGLRFTRGIWSHSSKDVQVPISADSSAAMDLETEISITSIGPALIWRPTKPGGDADFTIALSGGVAFYEENTVVDASPLNVTGESLYGSLVAALDLHVTENMTLGGSVGFILGTLKQATYTSGNMTSGLIDLDEDSYNGLQRLHYGLQVGVVF